VRDFDRYPKVFLQTGDCFLGVRPTLVTTVLGSCVGITLCAPRKKVGAICHAFLPDSTKFNSNGKDPQVCRFVDTALESMFSSLMRLKISPEELVVKVFGGASGIMSRNRCDQYDIGGRNLASVRERLATYGIKVARSATGGSQGRKLLFLTHTGDVWVKTLHKNNEEIRP